MKNRRLLGALVVALVLPAASAQAKTVHGTVVHRNHRAHSFVIARRGGNLMAVHAARSPRVGRRVALRAVRLANGTFAARRLRLEGRDHRAALEGTVTFVDPAARTFTLSSRGASILVHVADTTIGFPAVGDRVVVRADLDRSTATTIEALDVIVNPVPSGAGAVEIEGKILAIDTTTRTLMISADDSAASDQAVSVVLPAGFDIGAFTVGDEIEVEATLNPDGVTYTAVGTSGDESVGEAEHHGDDQGDVGEHHHGEHGGQDNSGPGNAGDRPAQTPAPVTEPGDDQGSGDSQGSGDDSGHDGSGHDSGDDGHGGSGHGGPGH